MTDSVATYGDFGPFNPILIIKERQNAPLPSPPPCSASMVRSVAVKPLAPSELYGSCLSRAGRTAQGLLGGLCLFLLLLLLSAEDDEVSYIYNKQKYTPFKEPCANLEANAFLPGVNGMNI